MKVKVSGPLLSGQKRCDWKPHHDGRAERAGIQILPNARGREFPRGVGGKAPDAVASALRV
jgi:hypothetical protein